MPDRRVLVFGHSGQLARELARQPWPSGFSVECCGRAACDLLAGADPAVPIERRAPSLVVNAAAYTAVDRAESEPDAAFALNRDAAGRIAAACDRRAIPLVHVSTDYVFDGRKPTPYVEDDPVAPLSAYGRSKAAGEDAVRSATGRHVILRTAWVYSPFGSNFVKTMLSLGQSRDRLRVATDQRGSPTAAAEIARAVTIMAGPLAEGAGRYGTWHFAGGGAASRLEWATAIFERAATHGRPMPRIEPAMSAEFTAPAPRPANSALNCDKITREWFILPRPWRAALDDTVDEILAGENRDEA